MTSLGDAVIRIEKAIKNRTAPDEFKRFARAVRSPVDLSCAIVRWLETIDDEAIAALDPEVIKCCRTCATAVRDFRLHGLEKSAAAMLTRLPAPPKAAPTDNPPPKPAPAVDATTGS